MKKSVFLWFFILLCCLQNYCYDRKKDNAKLDVFTTLTDLRKYALTHNEFPDIDNIDWFYPDYTSFHKRALPSFFEKLLRRIGIKKPLWTVESFIALLKQITKDRELNGYIGRFIQKMVPEPGTQFIIFGNLHSAFHSLVRDLGELKLQGIINNDLKIIKPHCYFVFNGDVVDQSPYILETLMVVMQLMHINPDHVFYIRGRHEDKQIWHDYGLRQELIIRARHLSEKTIPFNSKITSFFNTLPLALYLVAGQTKETIDVVRISNYGIGYKELREERFAGFLETPGNEKPQLFRLTNRQTSKKKVDIKAIIKGENLTVEYRPTPGAKMLGRQKGVITWATLSSPIGCHRRLFEFFYDTFVTLTIYPKVDDWILTLYNQDVREQLGFVEAKIFNLLSGFEAEVRAKPPPKEESIAALKRELETERQKIKKLETELVEGKKLKEELKKEEEIPRVVVKEKIEKEEVEEKIFFGTTLDLSKGFKRESKAVKSGLHWAITDANEAGGIRGRELALIPLDDEYTPKLARKNIEILISKYNINRILCPTGTPTLEAYLDLIKEGKILVLFPITGASKFRTDTLNMIHLMPSYRDEGYTITKYAIEQLNAKKIAFFFQDDLFGKDPLEGAQTQLREMKIKDWVEVSYDRNDLNFGEERINKLLDPSIDTIIFFSTATAAKALINQAGIQKLRKKKLLSIRTLGGQDFREFIQKNDLKLINTNVVPNPAKSSLPIVEKFRNKAKAHGRKRLDVYALESYISASFLINILKKLKDPITNEAILKAASAIQNVNFEGLILNWDSSTRQLSHTLWLNTGKPEWQTIELKKEKKVEKEIPEEPKKEVEVKVVEDRKIKIGTTLDLTRSIKQLGVPLKNGMEMYFSKVNREGGIDGRIIDLHVLDDGYVPEKARANVIELLTKYNIDTLLTPLGSPTLNNYLDMVKKGKVLVLFPLTGSTNFRKPDLKYLVNFRASYYKEGYALVKNLLKTEVVKQFVFFFQDDAFGRSCLKGGITALKEADINEWIEISHRHGETNFRKQVKKLKGKTFDAIGFFAVSTAAINFIRQLGIPALAGKKLFGVNTLGEITFQRFIKRENLSFTVSYPVPNPKASNLEIAKEFRDLAKEYDYPLETYLFEGYLTADLFGGILKKVKGIVTKEKIISVAESLKDYNFKGIKLNFDPETRQLCHTLWLDTGKDKWEEITLKKEKKVEKEIPEEPKKEVEVKVDEGRIKIGTTLDLTRSIKQLGISIKNGMQMCFEEVNKKGGINGKIIDLHILDDGYVPERARENVLSLLKNNIDILLTPIGSSTLLRYLDLVKEKKVLVLFPTTAASEFRKPDLINLINFRIAYSEEIYTSVKYLLKTGNINKFAFFFQNDAFGLGCLEGAKKALKEAGITKWIEIPHRLGETDLKKQVTLLKEGNFDALGFFTTSTASINLIRQAGIPIFIGKQLFGVNTLGETTFQRFIERENLKVIVSYPVPDPERSSLEIVQEFRKLIQKKDLPCDAYTLEGYITASLFVDMVKKISGPVTKEKIRAVAESLKDYNFKGLILDFDPETRQLSHTVWIDTGEEEWKKIAIKKEEISPAIELKKEIKEEIPKEKPKKEQEAVAA